MALSQAKTEGEFQAEMNDIIMNEDTKSTKSTSAKDTQTKLKHWQPDPKITKEQLEEMRVEVVERIIVARVGLLLRHPWFGVAPV